MRFHFIRHIQNVHLEVVSHAQVGVRVHSTLHFEAHAPHLIAVEVRGELREQGEEPASQSNGKSGETFVAQNYCATKVNRWKPCKFKHNKVREQARILLPMCMRRPEAAKGQSGGHFPLASPK